MAESQLAYEYGVAHLAGLDLPSALRFLGRFPNSASLSAEPIATRIDILQTLFGKWNSDTLVNRLDELLDRADTEIQSHESQGIRVISLTDPRYPQHLRMIPNPPIVIFYRGELGFLSEFQNVAVVGTRESTQAGESNAWSIANRLCQNGGNVVSGLAKGIDTAAHCGALASKCSRTAAVMPVPLNEIYPEDNKQLAHDILDSGGCWISELPNGKKGNRNSFVKRDRIQSGLSVTLIPI